MHFDFQKTVAGAGLAAAPLHVEGESAGAVASGLGIGGGGEELPDVVEEAGVGGGVGPWGPADGGLVDGDDLVQMLLPLQGGVFARPDLHPVQVGTQPLEENFVHQGGLTRPGHAGDAGEGPQGEGHVDVGQVVFGRSPDHQLVAVAGAAGLGDGDGPGTGEVLTGEGVWLGHHVLHGAGGDDFPPVDPCLGADVDEVVGCPHGVLVVLHHDEGVAQIPQVLQGLQEHVVVPLVEADGGLVQDIQHPHEGGADLGGQADALALTAGEGPGLAVQGQVGKAHALEEAQAGLDLLQDLPGDLGLGLGEDQSVHKGQGLVHRLVTEFVDVQSAHRDGQSLLFQAAASAGGAGALAHALLQFLPGGIRLGLHEAALHVVQNAFKGLLEGPLAVGPGVGEF